MDVDEDWRWELKRGVCAYALNTEIAFAGTHGNSVREISFGHHLWIPQQAILFNSNWFAKESKMIRGSLAWEERFQSGTGGPDPHGKYHMLFRFQLEKQQDPNPGKKGTPVII